MLRSPSWEVNLKYPLVWKRSPPPYSGQPCLLCIFQPPENSVQIHLQSFLSKPGWLFGPVLPEGSPAHLCWLIISVFSHQSQVLLFSLNKGGLLLLMKFHKRALQNTRTIILGFSLPPSLPALPDTSPLKLSQKSKIIFFFRLTYIEAEYGIQAPPFTQPPPWTFKHVLHLINSELRRNKT